MLIRAYRPFGDDARATMQVFWRAIRVTSTAHYSPEQIAVWARDDLDPDGWDQKRVESGTIIAELYARVAGFTDLDDTGYIDMLFVHPDFARRSVATALLKAVTDDADARGIPQLSVHASFTARPVFERAGFAVVEERHPVIRGVEFTNFRMTRSL